MPLADKKSAFFYGTLMHPEILRRVIGNKGRHLKICPAILMDYTRHRVRHADFPGIVPYDKGRKLLKRDPEPEERCVRGTLVTGLAIADVRRLDAFEGEGDMYVRQAVQVTPLEGAVDLEKFVDGKGTDKDLFERIMPTQPAPADDILGNPEMALVETETYVYISEGDLEPELWSFSEFLKEKAWQWYNGTGGGYWAKEDSQEGEARPEETEFGRGSDVVGGTATTE